MYNKMKEMFQKGFIKNVVVLVSGTMAAQIISILLSPLITRIYGPETFGILGTFTAVLAMLGPISALTYPIAIVLPKDENEVLSINKLSLYIIIAFTVITSIILLFSSDNIIRILHLESLSPYIYFIPFAIFFMGFLQITEQYLIRQEKFIISSKAAFFTSLFSNTGKVGAGILVPQAATLISISSLQSLLKLTIIFLLDKNIFKKIFRKNDVVNLKFTAKKYKDFPIFRAPENLLFSINQGLPLILLTSFFGPAAAGFYSISQTVLRMPSSIIGKAVGDVFYPRISNAKNNEESLYKLIFKATFGLAAVGLIPFSIIFLFGPILFELIFGSEWFVAGEYARWLSLILFFAFIKNPSIRALPVLSAQRFHLFFSVIILLMTIISFFISFSMYENDVKTLIVYSVLGSMLHVIQIFMTFRISKKYDANKKLLVK